ncbi:MAG: hypothetical protein HY784_17240, partial [Chloroflexi bacterium]|nr:hypothetical protein [Chloroflexota bacterium]
ILRWTFVEKGWALIHGACLAFGDQAYLITSRTDKGKTTTLLKILSQQRQAAYRAAFISDDLTLVSPEGRVLTYPKPLTISAHTVRAINATCLSWRERLFLPVQSRIRSRNGRRFAHQLKRTPLPLATINAVVQFLVPPPKYLIQELVPGAKLAREAKLAEMFVIEREEGMEMRLAPPEALDVLMRNCEDAYGFPPYPEIESFLYLLPGRDLRAVEREIVASALEGVPTTLIRRQDADWWPRILARLDDETHAVDFSPRPEVDRRTQRTPSAVA